VLVLARGQGRTRAHPDGGPLGSAQEVFTSASGGWPNPAPKERGARVHPAVAEPPMPFSFRPTGKALIARWVGGHRESVAALPSGLWTSNRVRGVVVGVGGERDDEGYPDGVCWVLMLFYHFLNRGVVVRRRGGEEGVQRWYQWHGSDGGRRSKGWVVWATLLGFDGEDGKDDRGAQCARLGVGGNMPRIWGKGWRMGLEVSGCGRKRVFDGEDGKDDCGAQCARLGVRGNMARIWGKGWRMGLEVSGCGRKRFSMAKMAKMIAVRSAHGSESVGIWPGSGEMGGEWVWRSVRREWVG
jgi:hypothetical protein